MLSTQTQLGVVLGFLRNRNGIEDVTEKQMVRKFTFYLLEDHSGGDSKYETTLQEKGKPQRHGPIENEQRVETLNGGIILDLMPHVIAILAHFGRVESLRVTHVRAGQYEGVDGDPHKRTEIKGESFAEVRFLCFDHTGKSFEGVIYVGKGIKGSRELGSEYNYDTKLLIVEGVDGNKIRFDLRSQGNGASEAHLVDKRGKTQLSFALNRDPYFTFLQKIADGSCVEDHLALNVEVGKKILEVIQDMRHPILRQERPLRTYACGLRGYRESDYLEDLIARKNNALPILYGT
jgi:hypothetical protein